MNTKELYVVHNPLYGKDDPVAMEGPFTAVRWEWTEPGNAELTLVDGTKKVFTNVFCFATL